MYIKKVGEIFPLTKVTTNTQQTSNMKVINLGSNKTQLNLNDGTEVFVSYETPVAAKLPNYDYIRTATKWSRTTSKHINQWLENVSATEVDQSFLDNLIQAV